jgi:hypothetical protein
LAEPHSNEPLFSQLIAMSGTSLIKAKQPGVAEKHFTMALELLDLNGKGQNISKGEQVKALLGASTDDILEKIGRKIPFGPIVDGDRIPRATTFSAMADDSETGKLFPGMTWCKRIMVGDCQMDVRVA